MTRRNSFLALLGLLKQSRCSGAELKSEQAFQYSPIVDSQGRIAFRFPTYSAFVNVDIGGGKAIRMSCVPGGVGTIGEDRSWQSLRLKSTPVHRVRIRPFLLGSYEVTQSQWLQASKLPQVNRPLQVLFREPLSPDEGNWPIEDPITHFQAEEFCARVSRYSGIPFRLPSESEWEYACRAGTKTRYFFGDTYGTNLRDSEVISLRRFQPVGRLNAPNRFGLHDMHGGLNERCEDWENESYLGAPDDGRPWVGVGNRAMRIVRGYEDGQDGGSAARTSFLDAGFRSLLGLRVAASIDHGILDRIVEGCAHAASFATGTVSPGQLISIFGDNIGPLNAVTGNWENGLLGKSLEGVEVYLDEFRAPILFASRRQVNVVTPFGVAGRENIRIVVRNGFQSAHFLEQKCTKAQPGLFTMEGTGKGLVLALREDGTNHSATSPIRAGSVATVFGTGFGLPISQWADGQVVTLAERFREGVKVFVGGQESVVEYAGTAPGQLAGIAQVNFRVPPAAMSGARELVLEVAGERSASGVTVAVE